VSSGRTSRIVIKELISQLLIISDWTFTVIFLLETSKVILHCHQSGDDNIAAYGFDGDEMNIR
jgi:hypothetical protein